jgi:signal transduction histidine kinase
VAGHADVDGRRPALWWDAATALVFTGVLAFELSHHVDDGYRYGATSWNLPILLGTVAALVLRNSAPGLAVTLGYGCALVPSLFVAHTMFFFGTLLPLLLLTFTATRRLAVRGALLAVAGPLLLLVVVPLHQPDFDAGDYLFWAVVAGIAVTVGVVLRRLDDHRAALATALAEQVHDQELRERALLLDERSRIARELHDVVAHAVSLMVVQAGAARLAVGLDDEEARAGMHAVEAAGRDALLDLRRLLSVLRPEEPSDEAPAPAPGVALLPDLVERLRGAGLAVSVDVEGEPWRLPAGLDLSVYRIVQESLTNTLKHAGATAARVMLRYEADELVLDVVDDGPHRTAHARNGGGHGLVGMRERAKIFGGTVEARPEGRGWRVSARLPRPLQSERADVGVPR